MRALIVDPRIRRCCTLPPRPKGSGRASTVGDVGEPELRSRVPDRRAGLDPGELSRARCVRSTAKDGIYRCAIGGQTLDRLPAGRRARRRSPPSWSTDEPRHPLRRYGAGGLEEPQPRAALVSRRVVVVRRHRGARARPRLPNQLYAGTGEMGCSSPTRCRQLDRHAARASSIGTSGPWWSRATRQVVFAGTRTDGVHRLIATRSRRQRRRRRRPSSTTTTVRNDSPRPLPSPLPRRCRPPPRPARFPRRSSPARPARRARPRARSGRPRQPPPARCRRRAPRSDHDHLPYRRRRCLDQRRVSRPQLGVVPVLLGRVAVVAACAGIPCRRRSGSRLRQAIRLLDRSRERKTRGVRGGCANLRRPRHAGRADGAPVDIAGRFSPAAARTWSFDWRRSIRACRAWSVQPNRRTGCFASERSASPSPRCREQ